MSLVLKADYALTDLISIAQSGFTSKEIKQIGIEFNPDTYYSLIFIGGNTNKLKYYHDLEKGQKVHNYYELSNVDIAIRDFYTDVRSYLSNSILSKVKSGSGPVIDLNLTKGNESVFYKGQPTGYAFKRIVV